MVYEKGNLVFEGMKYAKEGVTHRDFERLAEYEADLACFYHRMKEDPEKYDLEVVEEEKGGMKVVKGYFTEKKKS